MSTKSAADSSLATGVPSTPWKSSRKQWLCRAIAQEVEAKRTLGAHHSFLMVFFLKMLM